jgi:aryl-alcohol dehydrogenase-like predicted oxidoreductase
MMFGDRTDLAEAKNIVASAADSGVNFMDTADVYAKGATRRSAASCSATAGRSGSWRRRSAIRWATGRTNPVIRARG